MEVNTFSFYSCFNYYLFLDSASINHNTQQMRRPQPCVRLFDQRSTPVAAMNSIDEVEKQLNAQHFRL